MILACTNLLLGKALLLSGRLELNSRNNDIFSPCVYSSFIFHQKAQSPRLSLALLSTVYLLLLLFLHQFAKPLTTHTLTSD